MLKIQTKFPQAAKKTYQKELSRSFPETRNFRIVLQGSVASASPIEW
jgi:Tfp pilus assembly protein PilF